MIPVNSEMFRQKSLKLATESASSSREPPWLLQLEVVISSSHFLVGFGRLRAPEARGSSCLVLCCHSWHGACTLYVNSCIMAIHPPYWDGVCLRPHHLSRQLSLFICASPAPGREPITEQ